MDLYIIRHAWAGHMGDPQWPDDTQRPLSAEGRERFAKLIDKLAGGGLAPQVIAVSPMVRCVETAEILAERTPSRAQLVQHGELLPGGNHQRLLEWTAKQAQRSEQIAWVGHAPDVEQLAALAIGMPGGSIRFSKGAIAAIRFEASPRAGGGELRWLVTAKVLGC
ncbi:MAG: histidine phosphatase family protein [Thermoguttaceae bacterium]|jgi:phosphohistidine phosphatase